MKKITLFGRKPISLLLTAALVSSCSTGYYYLYQANAKLKPILPPLAAQRNLQQWLTDTATNHLESNLVQQDHMEGEHISHRAMINTIYHRTNYQLLWLDNYDLSEAGKELLQLLGEISADDIIDYDYHLAYLQQRLYHLPTRPRDATAVDILLTDAYISLAEDVLSEKLQPKNLLQSLSNFQPTSFASALSNPGPHSTHEKIIDLTVAAASDKTLKQVLYGFAPKQQQYLELRTALQHYRIVASSNVWTYFSGEKVLREDDDHAQIAQLRALLSAYGDYPIKKNNILTSWFSKKSSEEHNNHSTLFDADLVASLKQFQLRHGKKATGILDKDTREILNVSPSFRIKQIAFNMKRWRELPADLGKRYIWVNMPDYQLHVMENGRSILDMKVIVGKTSRRTPIMQEPVNSIVLNPSWNVPRRIMIQDILPKAKKDPTYLSKRNIRIIDGWQTSTEVPLDQLDLSTMSLRKFPYRLQQDAGEDNALGTIKFVIPNEDSIYLHDTNQPELFAKDYRALSSGCIRVEKPLALAETLLRGQQGWNLSHLEKILKSGKTTHINLPEKVPTYLFYWTAWVSDDGKVQFRDDIYNEDEPIKSRRVDLDHAML